MLSMTSGNTLHLRAIDDYKVVIEPKKDADFDQLLFATRLNGKPMSIDEKGPYRVIWAHEAAAAEAGATPTVKWIWSVEESREAR